MMDSRSILKEKPAGFADCIWGVRGRRAITMETDKAVEDSLGLMCYVWDVLDATVGLQTRELGRGVWSSRRLEGHIWELPACGLYLGHKITKKVSPEGEERGPGVELWSTRTMRRKGTCKGDRTRSQWGRKETRGSQGLEGQTENELRRECFAGSTAAHRLRKRRPMHSSPAQAFRRVSLVTLTGTVSVE